MNVSMKTYRPMRNRIRKSRGNKFVPPVSFKLKKFGKCECGALLCLDNLGDNYRLAFYQIGAEGVALWLGMN